MPCEAFFVTYGMDPKIRAEAYGILESNNICVLDALIDLNVEQNKIKKIIFSYLFIYLSMKALQFLRQVGMTKHGFNFKTCLRLFKASIRPDLKYGLPLLGSLSTTLTKLRLFQKRGICMLLGVDINSELDIHSGCSLWLPAFRCTTAHPTGQTQPINPFHLVLSRQRPICPNICNSWHPWRYRNFLEPGRCSTLGSADLFNPFRYICRSCFALNCDVLQ